MLLSYLGLAAGFILSAICMSVAIRLLRISVHEWRAIEERRARRARDRKMVARLYAGR